MNKVGTYGVAPGHISPVDAARIVLKEHMILALVVDQAVWVVRPILFWGKVKLRPILFIVQATGIGGLPLFTGWDLAA
ncbi:hypothetical protein ES703_44568 [subsurface metagenome]